MRDRDHGLAGHQRVEARLDRALDLAVERGGGLVQNEDRRVLPDHAGDGVRHSAPTDSRHVPRGALRPPPAVRALRAARARRARRAADDVGGGHPRGAARGQRSAQPRPQQPAAHPSARPPGAAQVRRHQRDRGRRRRAAVRLRVARSLPRAHPRGRQHLVRRVHRLVLLRRRPRPAQGHRPARHRHRRRAPRPPHGPAPAAHPRDGARPRPLPCGARVADHGAGQPGARRRGGPPLHRRRRPRGLPAARSRSPCATPRPTPCT